MANIYKAKKELLELFSSDSFEIHPKALEEFSALVFGGGRESDVLRIFSKNLHAMLSCEITELNKLSNFEILKNSNGMWSMHIPDSSLNIRMLFKPYNGYIFLCTFHERNDSRNTSYQPYIELAQKRFAEIKED